jgi:hypothetical protein
MRLSDLFDDCGPTVDVDERIWGTFVIKDATPRTDGQYVMVQQKLNGLVTFTNRRTGDFSTTFRSPRSSAPGPPIWQRRCSP